MHLGDFVPELAAIQDELHKDFAEFFPLLVAQIKAGSAPRAI